MKDMSPMPPNGFEEAHPEGPVPEASSGERIDLMGCAGDDADGGADVARCASAGAVSPDTGDILAPLAASRAQGRVGFGQRVKWLAAMFGIFILYVVIQAIAMIPFMVVVATLRAAAHGFLVALVVSQLLTVAVAYPLWRRVRRRGFVPLRAQDRAPFDSRRLFGYLTLMGCGIQLVLSVALAVVAYVFPNEMAAYAELMGQVMGDAIVVQIVAVAFLAPWVEEIVCRGLMLEFALRAVAPWDKQCGARGVTVSSRAFWVANCLQAAVFGIMHMNVVQSSYAFLLGLALGWAYWKTGKLRYAIALHFAVNASSYLVGVIDVLLGPVASLSDGVALTLIFLLGAVCLGCAWRGVGRVLGTKAPGSGGAAEIEASSEA